LSAWHSVGHDTKSVSHSQLVDVWAQTCSQLHNFQTQANSPCGMADYSKKAMPTFKKLKVNEQVNKKLNLESRQ